MLSLSGTFRATISSASSKAGIPSSSSATRNAWRREKKNKNRGVLSTPGSISKKVHCKQPHSNNNSTGEQLHQFNSYIVGTNGVMASSHCLEKSRQGAKNLAWQAGRSSLHSNSPGLPLLFLQPACVCECTAAESQAWQKGMCQSRLADSSAGSQPSLERSPINGGLLGACRQLSSLSAVQMLKLPASYCLLFSI